MVRLAHEHLPRRDASRRTVRKDQRDIVNSLYTVILSFDRVLIGTVKSIDYGRYDDGLAL